jgi:hypothetical protein
VRPVLASGAVDAERALADLLELSRDLEGAAVLGLEWRVLAASVAPEQAEQLGSRLGELVEEAERVKPGAEGRLTRLRAAIETETLYVVRDGDHVVAGWAQRSAAPGLLFHDLSACLRELAAGERSGQAADAPA